MVRLVSISLALYELVLTDGAQSIHRGKLLAPAHYVNDPHRHSMHLSDRTVPPTSQIADESGAESTRSVC
jgi:hypothetical protein